MVCNYFATTVVFKGVAAGLKECVKHSGCQKNNKNKQQMVNELKTWSELRLSQHPLPIRSYGLLLEEFDTSHNAFSCISVSYVLTLL